ncbi:MULTISPECIES: DUF1995 family protein [unclassified Synechococcus]|uniref:DUF1995 family protein n=1 Tax=unclassified Synechococcus TaxID=2626047 RepID=UPI0000698D18|nr:MULTISPECIES: DUF1995 family protein [unclassified Synechococcus]EAQ74530.1 hypothetical protein WH5701_13090 [Synechococcus sp. WH 5701]WFN58508.1 DUF1995 family protein [Synechococcus sp. CCFWC 502]
MLPADLRSAEGEALVALKEALADSPNGRWTMELRFEGLKLLPLALRLLAALKLAERPVRLLFPDAGAAALARRDAPGLAPQLGSLGDQLRRQEQDNDPSAGDLLVLVEPVQAEYEEVERLCQAHRGGVVLLNGRLEDAAVGIGSVARERRRGFLATWRPAYALLPLENGALRFACPGPWELYRLDPDGYRGAASFDLKPDAEQQAEALSPEQGPDVVAGLQALDRFIGSLRN